MLMRLAILFSCFMEVETETQGGSVTGLRTQPESCSPPPPWETISSERDALVACVQPQMVPESSNAKLVLSELWQRGDRAKWFEVLRGHVTEEGVWGEEGRWLAPDWKSGGRKAPSYSLGFTCAVWYNIFLWPLGNPEWKPHHTFFVTLCLLLGRNQR